MVKKLIISNSINTIRRYYPNYSEDEIERIKYGLESIYLSLTKVIVILLLSIILKIFKETIILLLLFNVLRATAFGIHASKSWMCWVSSVPTFIGIPLICKYITFPNYILILVATYSLLNFIFFAPADTAKRPLIRKNRRRIYKLLTIILGTIYLVAIIYIKDCFWQNTLASSMLIESILISPLTYKIFKMSYNNYKSYGK